MKIQAAPAGNPAKSLRPSGASRRAPSCAVFLGLGAALVASAAQAQSALSLHDAIERAQTSPAARIAQEQVNQGKGQLRQAGLRPNPRLYLSTEDVRPWANDFSFANGTEDYAYLGQTFETDGKRSKRVQLARTNLRRSETEQALQMQQIAGRVAGAYWSAAASTRVQELLQQDLAAMDEMVRYHKERVDAGAMRGVDLIRMQIERDRVFLALQAARRDLELARVELFRQIGVASSRSITLTDPIGTTDPIPQVPIAVALTQRLDVVAARDAVDAAEADLKLQRSIGVPDPDILGGYKRNSGSDTLFASLQIPLPFRNRNQGEVERAQASVRIARAQLESAELSARADIEAASAAYEAQQQIVRDTLPDMREHARKNLEIMQDAYRSGGVDLLRYIDAERTEIDVEVNAVRTLTDYHQSVLRLQFAYGVQP